MSCFFKNQVLLQFCLLRRWMVHLPEQLDEQVETLHFPALGAVLTVFAQQQAASTGLTRRTSMKTLWRPPC